MDSSTSARIPKVLRVLWITMTFMQHIFLSEQPFFKNIFNALHATTIKIKLGLWYSRMQFTCNYFYFRHPVVFLNPLTPNDPYRGRSAPLTSKRCILCIYSTNIDTGYFKHGIYSPFFSLQNAVCLIILTYFVPVLFTFYIQGVLKLKKKSGAKRLRVKHVLIVKFKLFWNKFCMLLICIVHRLRLHSEPKWNWQLLTLVLCARVTWGWSYNVSKNVVTFDDITQLVASMT